MAEKMFSEVNLEFYFKKDDFWIKEKSKRMRDFSKIFKSVLIHNIFH